MTTEERLTQLEGQVTKLILLVERIINYLDSNARKEEVK